MQKVKQYSYFLFLLIFFIIFIGIVFDWFSQVDQIVYSFSMQFFSNKMTTVMKGITFLGSAPCLIFLIILGLFLFKENITKLYLLIMMISEELCNLVIKYIVARPRPLFPHLVTENSYSFPSGHAMGATAFYGTLLLIIYYSKLSKKVKIILSIIITLIIFSICFSRIYLGVHYFTDVMAGIFFSMFLLGIFKDVFRKVIE